MTIPDGATGSQVAILSGHTNHVRSLTFSSDGASLVSGGSDKTIKLWDVQTSGVIKTFHGHTSWVNSVSISADCTTIASASHDKTIHLWDVQTGGCHCIIEQQEIVRYVMFSPTNSQYLISASGNEIYHWGIDGYQINPPHDGSYAAFSLGGTQLVLCQGIDIVVQNSDSGVIVVRFHIFNWTPRYCCFSPDGRLIAVVSGKIISVWDITCSDPHLTETFIGHTHTIASLVFPSTSSLITLSHDDTIKFWQIITPPTDPSCRSPRAHSTCFNSNQICHSTSKRWDFCLKWFGWDSEDLGSLNWLL